VKPQFILLVWGLDKERWIEENGCEAYIKSDLFGTTEIEARIQENDTSGNDR
jgi:hypothetical protein